MPRQMSYARPKDLRKTLRQFAGYLGKHLWTLSFVSVLVIISGLANLIGTYFIKDIINQTYLNKDYAELTRLCLLVLVNYLLGVLGTLGYTQIMARLAQDIIYEMRKDMFDSIEDLPIEYYDTHSFGNIMSIFTNDIDSLSDTMNNAFANLIQEFVQIIGTVVFVFVLSWRLSLIVMVFYGLMFGYIIFSGKKAKGYYAVQQKKIGELNGFVEETIRGQKTVKVFNHEQASLESFSRKSDSLRDASVSALTYSNTMIPMVMSLSYINYAIVAIFGGLLAYNGLMDLGTIASYLVFVRQTSLPINRFTQQANIVLNSMASAERVFRLINERKEDDRGTVRLSPAQIDAQGHIEETQRRTGLWVWKKPRPDGTYEYVPLEGDVRFDDVCFAYKPGHEVLKNISLYAKPGQKIAFVGSTGAGKTTITNLINRFYDISHGTITFDGINIKDIRKDDLRRSLGMVLQDTHLFSGSIEDNIRYGRLGATHEEVVNAAKLANADSFIRRLPEGYDTRLTADGSNLSQGQRQLLAIARAAISDPPVLILDEATSSIDTHTEHLVQEGMDKLMENRTVFVIAHRLSTVRNANAIIVLEHGQIIERGDHDALLARKGRYYSLYTGQAELS